MIVKRPALPHCAVADRSRNTLYYYYYMADQNLVMLDFFNAELSP